MIILIIDSINKLSVCDFDTMKPAEVIDQLLDACRRELPGFMVPASVQWQESLPRNPNGKIDRKQLTADYAELFGQEN